MKPADFRGGERSITVIIAIFAVVVGVLAVVFAQSDQVSRIAVQAMEIRQAEASLSAITELRANLGIGLVLASAESSGVRVEESPERAVEEARRSLGEVEGLMRSIDRPGIEDLLTETTVLTDRVLTMLDSGDLDGANQLARESLLPLLAELESFLNSWSAEAARVIEIEGSTAGDVARATSLAVALIVPALAVLGVRRSLRKRAEREVLKYELETERAHNRERDELISSLSHQIRTPLAGVYGFAETMTDLIEDEVADRDFMKEASTAIYTQAFEIRRLIDDMLVAARHDTGTLERSIVEVDVRRAAEAAAEPFWRSGLAVTVDVEPGLVMADYLRLQHILRNLIHNAVSHGGSTIALVGRGDAESYRLVVADDGAGLVAGSPNRRFTPFVHRDGAATTSGALGLGLAVASRLAELMNAGLRYERATGESLFVLSLERPDTDPGLPALNRAVAEGRRSGG